MKLWHPALAVLLLGCVPHPAPVEANVAPAAPEVPVLPEAALWGTYGGALPDADAGTFLGKVVDGEGGAPVAGAQLAVYGDTGRVLAQAHSVSDGSFILAVPAAARVVTVSARGFAFQALGVGSWHDDRAGGLLFQLDKAVRVEGRVFDSRQVPVPEAEVWTSDLIRSGHWPKAISRVARTDSAGRFTIEDSPDGVISVQVRAPGSLQETAVTVGQAGPGRELQGVELVFPEPGRVDVQVFAANHSPAKGATVAVFGEVATTEPQADARGTTDAGGHAELRPVPGPCWIAAALGTSDGWAAITVPQGDLLPVELHLQPRPQVDGKVLDPSGAPLAGAEVKRMYSLEADPSTVDRAPMALNTLLAGFDGVKSGADGRFHLPNFAPGDTPVSLLASLPGWAPGQAAAPGETTLHLVPTANIVGRVLFPGGRWHGRAGINYNGPGDGGLSVAHDGSFRLEDLSAGTWKVGANAAGFEDGPPVEVVLAAGATQQVELRLGKELPSATVRGQVVDRKGVPIAGVRVSAARKSWETELDWDRIVRTDRQGRFEIRAPAGKVFLVLYHPEHRTKVWKVDAAAGSVKEAGTRTLE